MNIMIHKEFKHIDGPQLQEKVTSETLPNGTRYYSIDDDYKYPSVTTVTGFDKKAFFAEWRKKNPVESRRVLNRGNKLHSLVEDYINNKEPNQQDYDIDIWQLFTQIKSSLDKIDNIHAQEVPLYSHLLRLAGRVDCVGEYDGKLSIIDFKGSTREKWKKNIENYFQQATAYAIMWQEMYDVKIEQVVIIISSEDGASQTFIETPIDYVKSLKGAIDNYYNQDE